MAKDLFKRPGKTPEPQTLEQMSQKLTQMLKARYGEKDYSSIDSNRWEEPTPICIHPYVDHIEKRDRSAVEEEDHTCSSYRP